MSPETGWRVGSPNETGRNPEGSWGDHGYLSNIAKGAHRRTVAPWWGRQKETDINVQFMLIHACDSFQAGMLCTCPDQPAAIPAAPHAAAPPADFSITDNSHAIESASEQLEDNYSAMPDEQVCKFSQVPITGWPVPFSLSFVDFQWSLIDVVVALRQVSLPPNGFTDCWWSFAREARRFGQ